ncbi:UDP-2-acetamido-2-deoxy-3-oxo-D-glucuronate aminotransferase-like [Teleopsis dalmanni]|uniref:UDP-2-acetamido-2-deoxy-3-oxo-D-glucuronate aminotransferase-like n=1 Tax=Teleopsis dalmanni TaxID=139649 RepID=UPI0018CF70D3|nr:UDP-2-acetamido-2-deoxy-3-oxo-D-glucuronate aminotransferase-like [Teleopsis dalmanni]
MVDLQSQYQKIKEDVDTAILNVLGSAAFINGPEVKQFETELQDYLDVKYVIPCANGTDALQIALMSLGLEPGDEVITADFTFAATVEVVDLLKLTSVLVDVDYTTFTIDIEKLKSGITLNKSFILFFIDTAQAIGADYKGKKAGTIGHIGCTSFFPSKNLGCYGDGGAIFTNDDELAHKLRGIVNHGMYKRYYHDEVGVNSRLDSVQAAVLRKKLPLLDSYNEARNKAAAYYSEAFKDIEELLTPELFTEKEIPAMIYYPVPLRKQKAYNNGHYNDADFPNTNKLVEEVISLPMHTELDDEQLMFITSAVKEFFGK